MVGFPVLITLSLAFSGMPSTRLPVQRAVHRPAAAGSQAAQSRVSVSRITRPRMGILDRLFGGPQDDDDARGGALDRPAKQNKYYDQIVNISAPELVQSFAQTAPPEVQQAVRTTVMGLFGGLPSGQFETTVTSTSQNMASLMCALSAAL